MRILGIDPGYGITGFGLGMFDLLLTSAATAIWLAVEFLSRKEGFPTALNAT